MTPALCLTHHRPRTGATTHHRPLSSSALHATGTSVLRHCHQPANRPTTPTQRCRPTRRAGVNAAAPLGTAPVSQPRPTAQPTTQLGLESPTGDSSPLLCPRSLARRRQPINQHCRTKSEVQHFSRPVPQYFNTPASPQASPPPRPRTHPLRPQDHRNEPERGAPTPTPAPRSPPSTIKNRGALAPPQAQRSAQRVEHLTKTATNPHAPEPKHASQSPPQPRH